jgi:hypothetical protein
MKVKELREGLNNLRNTLKSWQVSKSSSNDLERLETLLAGFDDLTVTQFCNKAEKALTGTTPKQSRKSVKLHQDAIDQFTDELNSIGEDRVLFLSFFADLKADKRIRLSELRLVANSYIGNNKTYRNKSDAFEDIELTFEAKISTTRRLKNTSDIF